MADVFSYYHEIPAPDGTVFNVWTRYSFDAEVGAHNDLSVECVDKTKKDTEYGLKYHGHLEHPVDEPTANERMCEIEPIIRAGGNL